MILLTVLVASFIFWKLSQIRLPKNAGAFWISSPAKQIKRRGRCLIPLKWRIVASLVILMLIPALVLFGLAIAVVLALGLLVALVAFVLSWFRVRKY